MEDFILNKQNIIKYLEAINTNKEIKKAIKFFEIIKVS